jgi:hypothetical protein
LILLVLLMAPPSWVKKQAAKAGCTCGKKDAALSAAEANRVVLRVEPADDTS